MEENSQPPRSGLELEEPTSISSGRPFASCSMHIPIQATDKSGTISEKPLTIPEMPKYAVKATTAQRQRSKGHSLILKSCLKENPLPQP